MQICTHCQRENTDDSRFCVACGSALQASANETQPVSDAPTTPKVQAYAATGGQNLWETNKQEARKQIKKLEITKRLKARWWSIPYLLSGIVSFACGIKAVNEWCMIYDETAEFGADFYTYLYRVVRSMANGLEDISLV